LAWQVSQATPATRLRLLIEGKPIDAGEPFAWFEGVSVWPTEWLRMLAVVLALIFLVASFRSLRENDEDVTLWRYRQAAKGRAESVRVAAALTSNTVVCYFDVIDFKKFLQSNPFVALNYANIVNNKLRKLEGRHSDLVFHDAKSRLIRFIKIWASTDGNRIGDKIILNNYLTHSDIAGVIATSRQSVNVLLNELRDAGVLFYNRKKIELNDPTVWN